MAQTLTPTLTVTDENGTSLTNENGTEVRANSGFKIRPVFGSPQINFSLSANGFGETVTFGTAEVIGAQLVKVASFANGTAFGTATFAYDQSIMPDGFIVTAAFGAFNLPEIWTVQNAGLNTWNVSVN